MVSPWGPLKEAQAHLLVTGIGESGKWQVGCMYFKSHSESTYYTAGCVFWPWDNRGGCDSLELTASGRRKSRNKNDHLDGIGPLCQARL